MAVIPNPIHNVSKRRRDYTKNVLAFTLLHQDSFLIVWVATKGHLHSGREDDKRLVIVFQMRFSDLEFSYQTRLRFIYACDGVLTV